MIGVRATVITVIVAYALAIVGLHQARPAPYLCRFADKPIKIDGINDEKLWESALEIKNFVMPWSRDGKTKPPTATRAKLLWDRENLYFYAELDDSDLYADVKDHDGPVWTNDELEMFFKPAIDKPGYYEFQVNAANTKADAFMPRREAGGFERFKSDDKFDFQTRVLTEGTVNKWTDGDAKWKVEGRLGWSCFSRTGGRPNVDEIWRFALCRRDYSVDLKEPALSSNTRFMSSKPDFHRYEDYATIKFVSPDQSTQSEDAPKFGLDKLPKLLTSKVLGSPDPPLPYTVERLFPKLPIESPICVAKQPGSDLVWIVTEPWQYAPAALRRFRNDPNADKLETLLEPNSFDPDRKTDCVIYDIRFHPKFAENGYVFLGCNGPFGEIARSRVMRYHVDPKPPYKFDPKSATTIIEWESDGHNGAAISFDKDGMLLVTSGDGTGDSDLNLRGQDLSKLTSKMLRIDVDHPENGKNYGIPKDNPFVGQKGVVPETWAYGLRNPWRMDVDTKTGDIWVGNNGQDLWESVYFIQKGHNYGWSIVEGGHDFYPDRKRGPHPISKPAVDHSHSEARSLTGGIAYRGTKANLKDLVGAFIYGDFSTGKIWGVRHDGKQVTWHKELADTTHQITYFANGNDGDIWILGHGSKGIFRLIPTPPKTDNHVFPKRISESGLFKEVAKHTMVDGVLPYTVNAPLWSDGSYKERFIAIPYTPDGKAKIDYNGGSGWGFPENSVIVKSFALEMIDGDPSSRRWIETRFLVKQQGEWVGYAYRWNKAGTDAELVSAEGVDQVYEIQDKNAPNGVRKQTWHYPSRAECMVCHSRVANYLLGLQTAQMNCDFDYTPYGGTVDNQLRTMEHLKLFRVGWGGENHWREFADYAKIRNAELKDIAFYRECLACHTEAAYKEEANRVLSADAMAHLGTVYGTRIQRDGPQDSPLLPRDLEHIPKLADPYDNSLPLADRARSYLHSNCAHCHVLSGGGNSKFEIAYTTPTEATKLVEEKPTHDSFGIKNARLIAKGAPERSVLLYRISTPGKGRMPQLATSIPDKRAVELIRQWILSLDDKSSVASHP